MGRRETEFLLGFAKAALLTKAVAAAPPAFTTAQDYMKTVAQLHADADEALRRGLAVGCLAAVGEETPNPE
jgi:hypothetical protein